jgi:predicted dehydrogenase
VLNSYAELIADPNIDVVYIATTHQNHVTLARQALATGKAVLVEKPMGLHADEVAELIAFARRQQVFLMEAMWMRFIPAFRRFQKVLAEEVIGPVSLVQADFGIDVPPDPQGRMLNPDIGGGALWDLGIYPLTFSSLVFGSTPSALCGLHRAAKETGVDEQNVAIAQFPGGGLAQMQCGFRQKVPHQARVYGPKGRILIDDFFHPQSFIIELNGEQPCHIHEPYTNSGLQYEAMEVHRCLDAGLSESPLCPLDETLGIIRCLDALVTSWGITYPLSA